MECRGLVKGRQDVMDVGVRLRRFFGRNTFRDLLDRENSGVHRFLGAAHIVKYLTLHDFVSKIMTLLPRYSIALGYEFCACDPHRVGL